MHITVPPPELSSNYRKPSRLTRFRFGLLIVFGITISILVGYFVSRNDWLLIVLIAALLPVTLLLTRHVFTGILLWLLVMPFISVLPSGGLVYWAIYRILPVVLLGLVGLLRLLKVRADPPARIGPPELAMGIFILYLPISILLLQNDRGTAFRDFVDRMLIPFCMYLFIRLAGPREKEIEQLEWIALFIALSQSFIGFLSWFAPQVLPQPWHYLQGYRTTGSVKDPDLYAVLLTFSAVILVHGAINRKSKPIRFLFFAASGLSAIFAFLSLERAVWLGGIFVVIGLFVLYPKTMLQLSLIGTIVMVMLGSGILATHLSLSVERFTEASPVYDRIVIFDAMSQMFQEKPIFGWGYENLDQNIQQYYRTVGDASLTTRVVTSHNTYMTILTELGLVGLFLYLAPAFWWLVLSFRVFPRMPRAGLWSRQLLVGFWLVVLFIFTISNFIDLRFFPFGLALYWMTLGMIANMVYPYLRGRSLEEPRLVRVA